MKYTFILAFPRFPPPSYEESVSGAVNIRDAEDKDDKFVEKLSFAPLYAFYNCKPPEILEPEKKIPVLTSA